MYPARILRIDADYNTMYIGGIFRQRKRKRETQRDTERIKIEETFKLTEELKMRTNGMGTCTNTSFGGNNARALFSPIARSKNTTFQKVNTISVYCFCEVPIGIYLVKSITIKYNQTHFGLLFLFVEIATKLRTRRWPICIM